MNITITCFALLLKGYQRSLRHFSLLILLAGAMPGAQQLVCSQASYIPMVAEHKYWIYYDFTLRPRPTTGFLITIRGDTLVDNLWYKKVYKYALGGQLEMNPVNEPLQFFATYPYEPGSPELISLIREDVSTRQVYNRPVYPAEPCADDPATYAYDCNNIVFCDSTEHLLFDFGLQEKDTLNYCTYLPMSYPWNIPARIIDSVRYETHFNTLRKTYYSYGVTSFLPNLFNPGPIPESTVKILEGVGFLNQGIFHYRSANLKAFCEGSWALCNILSSIANPASEPQKIYIWPNPAEQIIRVESTARLIQVDLFDPGAKHVGSYNHSEIDVSQLPSGIYSLKTIDIDGQTGYGRFVKI